MIILKAKDGFLKIQEGTPDLFRDNYLIPQIYYHNPIYWDTGQIDSREQAITSRRFVFTRQIGPDRYLYEEV